MVDYILDTFSGAIAGYLQLGDFGWWNLLGRLWVVDFTWGTLRGPAIIVPRYI